MTLPDYQIEQGKADFLDLLYANSGRTDGHYTGLWSAYQRDLATLHRMQWIEDRQLQVPT
jgi:hypothetical protein